VVSFAIFSMRPNSPFSVTPGVTIDPKDNIDERAEFFVKVAYGNGTLFMNLDAVIVFIDVTLYSILFVQHSTISAFA
jgi:hypothetical protein